MRCAVSVRGERSEWSIDADLSKDAIEEMRADGLTVNVLIYTVPFWIAGTVLMRPWCFMQDVWNFRNPFWPSRHNSDAKSP